MQVKLPEPGALAEEGIILLSEPECTMDGTEPSSGDTHRIQNMGVCGLLSLAVLRELVTGW